MAQIHAAFNELEEKLKKKRDERWSHYHIPTPMDRVGDILGCLIWVAVCALFFFLMVKFPQIGIALRDGARWLVQLIKHPVLPTNYPGFTLFRGFLDQSTLVVVLAFLLDTLVNLAVWLLCLAVDLALLLVTWTLPFVCRWILYVLPLCFGIGALVSMFTDGMGGGYFPDISGPDDEEQVLSNGLEGERNALEHLRPLPYNCHVYTNLRIPHERGESETDMIVVSPVGVTVVEVKNHKGLITGNADDERLEQQKTLRDGRTEEKDFYNPIKQVATHVHHLKHYLQEHGVSVYVRSCVFFVNDEASVNIRNLTDRCLVFKAHEAEALRDFLSSGRKNMPDSVYDKAVSVLNDLTQKSFETQSTASTEDSDWDLDDLFN